MLVRDFKETEGYRLSDQTLLFIPNVCSSCGSDLQINPTITHLSCENDRCIDKITLRTVAMFDQLGVVDIGEPTIKKLVEAFDIDNPLTFFDYEPSDWDYFPDYHTDALERRANDIYDQLSNNGRRRQTLVDFIKLANLPNLQSTAEKLFEGYESLYDFYDDLEQDGEDLIHDLLEIQSDVSLRSIKLYETLMAFKEDLFDSYESGGLEIVLSTKADIKIKAVCSDEVGGGFKRKADFYNYIDEHYGAKIHIDWGKSVTKSIDVLIWAGADGSPARYTNKVSKVETWNEKDTNIPILTASQFLEIVESSDDGQTILDTLESLQ